MIRKILVPLDGAASAASALSIAGSIAGIAQAELLGLYIEDERRMLRTSMLSQMASFTGDVPVPMPLAPEDLAREETEMESESVRAYAPFEECLKRSNIVGQFLTLRGLPGAVLLERSRTVDLVIVSSDYPYLSTSEDDFEVINTMMHTVGRPMLLVPDEVMGESRMVVAYDGSLASERALRFAAEFAEISDMSRIHLLSVGSDIKALAHLQAPALEYLKAYSVEAVPMCISGSPDEAIAACVEEVDASIIALGAFGSNRLMERIFGSTTASVLRQAETAVLLA